MWVLNPQPRTRNSRPWTIRPVRRLKNKEIQRMHFSMYCPLCPLCQCSSRSFAVDYHTLLNVYQGISMKICFREHHFLYHICLEIPATFHKVIVSGLEKDDNLTIYQKFIIHIWSRLSFCSLYYAREMIIISHNWDICCRKAVQQMLLVGVETGCIRNWLLEIWKKNRKFDMRLPKKHRLPMLLDSNAEDLLSLLVNIFMIWQYLPWFKINMLWHLRRRDLENCKRLIFWVWFEWVIPTHHT